jgi:hypothetical protein
MIQAYKSVQVEVGKAVWVNLEAGLMMVMKAGIHLASDGGC